MEALWTGILLIFFSIVSPWVNTAKVMSTAKENYKGVTMKKNDHLLSTYYMPGISGTTILYLGFCKVDSVISIL